MPYKDGWAAINLEMPQRVPRTEYSADFHWNLIRAVTGVEACDNSDPSVRLQAAQAFRKAWKYDFHWKTIINHKEFGNIHTNMGHAAYRADHCDFEKAGTWAFTDPEEVLNFNPWEALGSRNKATITERFEEAYQNLSRDFPDEIPTTGIYVSLISGLIDLFGWEMLLLAAGINPERFGEVANRYGAWIQQYFDALAAGDYPVVTVHDDIVWTSGPFIHPDWYRKYVFPNYKKLLAPLIESGKKITYTSDGNYTEFIDDIAACGVHGFVMEPITDMAYVAEKYGKTHFFIGNADTRILLSGPKKAIRAEVERCMNIGKNCPGFFMAVGNHIPANTPIENAIYYNEVYEEMSRR